MNLLNIVFIYSQWRIESYYTISFSIILWSLFLGGSHFGPQNEIERGDIVFF